MVMTKIHNGHPALPMLLLCFRISCLNVTAASSSALPLPRTLLEAFNYTSVLYSGEMHREMEGWMEMRKDEKRKNGLNKEQNKKLKKKNKGIQSKETSQ